MRGGSEAVRGLNGRHALENRPRRRPLVVRPGLEGMGIRLTLLNHFELSQGGEPLPLPPGGQRVVAFLALRGRWIPRSMVAGMLWPDSPDDYAARNLRSALWRINLPGLRIIETNRTHLRGARQVAVDVHEVMDRARRLIAGATDGEAMVYDLLLGTLTAELLPDWDDEWVIVEREREIQAFKPEEYWRISALLAPAGTVPKPDKTKAKAKAVEHEEGKRGGGHPPVLVLPPDAHRRARHPSVGAVGGAGLAAPSVIASR